jgi:hypothetical protein
VSRLSLRTTTFLCVEGMFTGGKPAAIHQTEP